jgi:hypothetical protein
MFVKIIFLCGACHVAPQHSVFGYFNFVILEYNHVKS